MIDETNVTICVIKYDFYEKYLVLFIRCVLVDHCVVWKKIQKPSVYCGVFLYRLCKFVHTAAI